MSRVPAWVWLGGLLFVVVVASVGSAVWIRGRARAIIAVHQEEVDRPEEDLEPDTRDPSHAGEAGWDLLRPALDALWALRPMESGEVAWTAMESDFNAHGIPAETARLLEEGAASIDACRRSLQSPRFEWKGAFDPALERKTIRAARALMSKGFLAWQAGRDAEAVEWVLAAVGVAQTTARHRGRLDLLRAVEIWLFEEAKFLFSEQGLDAVALAEFGRRLDELRARRPAPAAEFQRWGRRLRHNVLEGYASLRGVDRDGDVSFIGLQDRITWRDLYSWDVKRARVLNGVSRIASESAGLPWDSSASIEAGWTALCARAGDEVGPLWKDLIDYREELAAALRWDFVRAAVSLAQVQAATGRLPTTGLPSPVRPLRVDGDRLIMTLQLPGELQNPFEGLIVPIEVDWPLRRRD